MDDLLKMVPTTRYQGSKRKILPWLYECMQNYEFHTVLDAFGGTGMVSYLFKRMGKRVKWDRGDRSASRGGVRVQVELLSSA